MEISTLDSTQTIELSNTQTPAPAETTVSISCNKCGKSDHQRSNSLKCPFNPINNTDDVKDLPCSTYLSFQINFNILFFKTTVINQVNEINANPLFMIARKKFNLDLIFGPNIDYNKNSPNYKRHVLPKRNTYCPHCEALMWYLKQIYL